MLVEFYHRWRSRLLATTAGLLLGGAALSSWPAEAPAAAGVAPPAEIPEPTSQAPASKKYSKPKSPSPAPAKKQAKASKPATEPALAKSPKGAEAASPASAAKSVENPKPAGQPSVVQSPPPPEPTPQVPAVKSLGKPEPVGEASAAQAPPEPEPTHQPPFVKDAENNWHLSLSFDDYRFVSPLTDGTGGTQSGNLYGESLSLAPPAWRGRTSFDVSYRQGLLYGTGSDANRRTYSLETLVNEVFAGFHFAFLPWVHDGKERGHMTARVGLSWDGWSTTETLSPGHTWASTGYPTLITDWNMFLGDLGLGYDLVLWNPTSKYLSYRLGIRAEAIGALGGANYHVQQADKTGSLAVYGLARGTAYMDLTLRNGIAIFVEGGYQQSWWTFAEIPPQYSGVNNFVGYWGGFVRAGVGLQF